MTAITYRMPFGVQGDISRPHASIVEAQAFGATAFPQYGLPAQVSAGKVIPVSGTGQVVYGFLARPFPTTGPNASDPLGTSVPPTSGPASIMRRGYIVVLVQLGGGSCNLGTGVFIRFQAPSGQQIVGGVEGATSANNYQITAALGGIAVFTGPVDSNNLAEVAFNL